MVELGYQRPVGRIEGAHGLLCQRHQNLASEQLHLRVKAAPIDPAGCPFKEVNSMGAHKCECESLREVTEAQVVGESKCDSLWNRVTGREVRA